eukprot:848374-Rhodomonas_salina.1
MREKRKKKGRRGRKRGESRKEGVGERGAWGGFKYISFRSRRAWPVRDGSRCSLVSQRASVFVRACGSCGESEDGCVTAEQDWERASERAGERERGRERAARVWSRASERSSERATK